MQYFINHVGWVAFKILVFVAGPLRADNTYTGGTYGMRMHTSHAHTQSGYRGRRGGGGGGM